MKKDIEILKYFIYIIICLTWVFGLLFIVFTIPADAETAKIKFINNTNNLMYYNLYWLDSGWPNTQYYGPPCVIGGELQAKATFTHDFVYSGGRFVLIWSEGWDADNEPSKDKRFDFDVDYDTPPLTIMATTEGVLMK